MQKIFKAGQYKFAA